MDFNNFPKKQNRYLIYTSYEVLKTPFFNDLHLQLSPKNSLYFRFLKTRIGCFLSSFKKQIISVPVQGAEYVGIVKDDVVILFEYANNEPIHVWRKNTTTWEKEVFIGRQLIAEYSINEFKNKYNTIYSVLKKHWIDINGNPLDVHGDFTHFNILVDKQNKVHLIDKKSTNHSPLFDFFYFYTYLMQALKRSRSLSKSDFKEIEGRMNQIVRDVCYYESKEELLKDFDNMKIPSTHGITDVDTQKNIFKNILMDN